MQNGAKCLQKLTADFKNHIKNLHNLTELKFDGLLLSK